MKKNSLPLEPDQYGYREGILRVGDIQRAIISIYDFTYISDAESMGLGIFFVRQDMAVFLQDGVCLLVRDLIAEVAGIRGTGFYGDLSCGRLSDLQGGLYGIVQSIGEQGAEADRVDALYIMEIYMEEAVTAWLYLALRTALTMLFLQNTRFCTAIWDSTSLKYSSASILFSE